MIICLNCDGEDFGPEETEIKQEYKGETLFVRTAAMRCRSCGWLTVGNDQIDELRKRTADLYRQNHCLLTSGEIKEMRESLGMTQVEFAKWLHVGEASVKRWETWLVQEQSSDYLMRLMYEQFGPRQPNMKPWTQRLTSKVDQVGSLAVHQLSTWNPQFPPGGERRQFSDFQDGCTHLSAELVAA